MVCWTEQKHPQLLKIARHEESGLFFKLQCHYSFIAPWKFTQIVVWLIVAGYGKETSIPKAKLVNQSFQTSAECAFLYAGLNTYLALQVNVTENNRILRDEQNHHNHWYQATKGQLHSTSSSTLFLLLSLFQLSGLSFIHASEDCLLLSCIVSNIKMDHFPFGQSRPKNWLALPPPLPNV